MKVLFKVNLDGTYTNIERVECDNTERYKWMLTEFPDDYFKSFAAAKKAALENMTYILKEWQYAVRDMRAQKKENY